MFPHKIEQSQSKILLKLAENWGNALIQSVEKGTQVTKPGNSCKKGVATISVT